MVEHWLLFMQISKCILRKKKKKYLQNKYVYNSMNERRTDIIFDKDLWCMIGVLSMLKAKYVLFKIEDEWLMWQFTWKKYKYKFKMKTFSHLAYMPEFFSGMFQVVKILNLNPS